MSDELASVSELVDEVSVLVAAVKLGVAAVSELDSSVSAEAA